MKTSDILILAAGLVVLYLVWKRMHSTAPVLTTPAVGMGNPLATLNQAASVAGNLAVKTAALPLTLGLSLTKDVAKGAWNATKSAAAAANPLSWGGDSAATKNRKEIQRQQTALKGAPGDYSAYNASMRNMGRPDLQVDNSAYTNYIATNGINEKAYYIA